MRQAIKIVRPFLKKRVTMEIVKTEEDLKNLVSEENILKEMGGSLDFKLKEWLNKEFNTK